MLISIVSPCYKAEKYLESTYSSLKSQTHKNWEWLIVDDCSTDNSWEVLQKIAQTDQRVRIFRLSKNSGPSVCRNKGLDEAKGEYVSFLDADDQWLSTKLQRQLDFMESNQIKMSCHAYKIMSDDEVDLKDVTLPKTVSLKRVSVYNPLATSFMMIKRESIGNTRFDESLRRRQDWVFWYALLKKIHICHNLNICLGRYRKDSVNSISKNKFHMAYLQWKMYRKYFKLSVLNSLCNFIRYACYGIRKHFQIKVISPIWFTPILVLGLVVAAVAAVD